MPINWQDKAVQDRLLVAVIASVDNNIKPHEIARLYGGSMTYNAVESYLRKFRKEAKEMKGSATDRAAPVPSPARPRKAASVSPKKAAAGVKTGRVVKNKSPVKIKHKICDDDLEHEDEDGPMNYCSSGNNGGVSNMDDDGNDELGVEV